MQSSCARASALARRIFDAGVKAVGARRSILDNVSFVEEKQTLLVCGSAYDLASIDEVLLLGAGKASKEMVGAISEVIPDSVALRGCCVTKHGHGRAVILPGDGKIAVIEAGHPVPDRHSVEGATELLSLAATAGSRTLVLACISGGASSLLCAPKPGLSLEDLQAANSAFLASGASIDEVNAMRVQLSAVKGGLLAEAVLRASSEGIIHSLVISDVIGDDPTLIGSGPTILRVGSGETGSYEASLAEQRKIDADNAHATAKRLGLLAPGALPPPVARALSMSLPPASSSSSSSSSAAAASASSSSSPQPLLSISTARAATARCRHSIVASNEVAIDAAATEAKGAGLDVCIRRGIEGEASTVARDIVHQLRTAKQSVCLVYGGETTVELGKNPGKGGRNQELALSAALALSELRYEFANTGRGVALLSGGTDGNDGPTNAAGALGTPLTVSLAAAVATDKNAGAELAQSALRRHDAYPFFESLSGSVDGSGLVMTGPTGTNVADLIVAVVV